MQTKVLKHERGKLNPRRTAGRWGGTPPDHELGHLKPKARLILVQLAAGGTEMREGCGMRKGFQGAGIGKHVTKRT